MGERKRLRRRDREEIHQMFDGRCAYCGCVIEYKNMQIDHVEALHIGGKDYISNMLPACRSCNYYKSTMTVEGFRAALMRMPQVLERDNVTYKIAHRFGVVQVNPAPIVFYFEKWRNGIGSRPMQT